MRKNHFFFPKIVLLGSLIVIFISFFSSCFQKPSSTQPPTQTPTPYPHSNNQWVEIGTNSATGGGISNSNVYANEPCLCLDSDGYPVVAWRGRYLTSTSHEVFVKRWNGNAWVEVGAGSASGNGISNNSGLSWQPSLRLDSAGFPVVAWADASDGNQVYIKHWNGTAWVEYGQDSASGGGITNNIGYVIAARLCLDRNYNPIVDCEVLGGIHFKQWNGMSWDEVGPSSGVSTPALPGSDSSFCLNSSDYPVVAWSQNGNGNFEIYVKGWNGADWVEYGQGSASGGGISNTTSFSGVPKLCLDSSGYPIVAWVEQKIINNTGYQWVYIKRWSGTAWVEIGDHSASEHGISGENGFSSCPSLKLDNFGNPIVAWAEEQVLDPDNNSPAEIYINRWNGTDWVEVGPNSTSAGGISNNSGNSMFPSFCMTNTGDMIVAWADNTSGNYEIYIKQFSN